MAWPYTLESYEVFSHAQDLGPVELAAVEALAVEKFDNGLVALGQAHPVAAWSHLLKDIKESLPWPSLRQSVTAINHIAILFYQEPRNNKNKSGPTGRNTVRSISMIRRASRLKGGKEDAADHVDDELLGKAEEGGKRSDAGGRILLQSEVRLISLHRTGTRFQFNFKFRCDQGRS